MNFTASTPEVLLPSIGTPVMKHSDVLHTQSVQQSSFSLARPLSTSCLALHIARSWFTVARTQRTQLATLISTRQEHSHQPIKKTVWARPDRVVGIYRLDRIQANQPLCPLLLLSPCHSGTRAGLTTNVLHWVRLPRYNDRSLPSNRLAALSNRLTSHFFTLHHAFQAGFTECD